MNTSIERVVAEIKELQQELGVISTSAGNPEAAVVYFSHDEHLNIYFTTRKDSRKYKNLLTNPHVAFVIFNQQLMKTVQLEGVAQVITDPQEQGDHFSKLIEHATKNNAVPPIDQINENEIMFIRIEATWARAGNFEITRTGDIFQEVTLQ